jgi:hypothetical protein
LKTAIPFPPPLARTTLVPENQKLAEDAFLLAIPLHTAANPFLKTFLYDVEDDIPLLLVAQPKS